MEYQRVQCPYRVYAAYDDRVVVWVVMVILRVALTPNTHTHAPMLLQQSYLGVGEGGIRKDAFRVLDGPELLDSRLGRLEA